MRSVSLPSGCAIVVLAIGFSAACRPRGEAPGPADPDRAPDVVAQAAFGQLQRLAGNWEGKMGRSETLQSPASVTFFVTGKGTAIVERMIIEDPVEMVSVYHLDRGRLVMAHYCAAGNQPRMVLGRASRADSLRFAFAGGTGLEELRDLHMHTKQLILSGPDRLLLVWETYVSGRAESVDTIFLTRSKIR